MKKILSLSICCFASLDAFQQMHDSIYNVPYSTAVYDNGLVTATEFTTKFNGKDNDLDVSDEFFIPSQGRQENFLQRAVLANNKELVQKLLKKQPILVNYKNKDDRTALHYATANNNSSMVLLLLDYGADINIQDVQGWTALHIAAKNDFCPLAQILIDKGANTTLKNVDSNSAKDYSVSDRMQAIISGKN